MANSQRTSGKTEGNRKCPQVLQQEEKKKKKGKQTASTARKAHYVPGFAFPFSFAISFLWPLCYFDFIL